ncbi:MAG: putative glycerol transport protein [Firmicutes bacterium]|nr:putative glycerol transport protein [Bacillota bacterium]
MAEVSGAKRLGRLILIGTGFMAITMVWQIYTAYLPLFYHDLVRLEAVTGFIIGADNLLGKFVQPWIGAMSDSTSTRLGRRVPFLLVGAPLAAIFISLIPLAVGWGLLPLIVTASCLNLAMAVAQSPTVALMPDVTPSHQRSSANGIISLMGGIGAVIAYFYGGKLYQAGHSYPFLLVGGMLLVVTLIFATLVRERQWALTVPMEAAPAHARTGFWASLKQAAGVTADLLRSRDVSAIGLFLAIFVWSVGYQAVETWFTTFATQVLGVSRGEAALSLAFTAGAVVLTAVPAGYLARLIGRRWTIRLGLLGLIALMLAMGRVSSLGTLRIMLALVGVSWALVTINAYPMVVDLVSDRLTGVYTGLYYVFSGLATLVGPLLFGILLDLGGNRALFPGTAACMLVALGLFWPVNRGEARPADGT